MEITRDQVMEYFRSDRYIDDLRPWDKYEIALDCIAHSEMLHKELEFLINRYENENL